MVLEDPGSVAPFETPVSEHESVAESPGTQFSASFSCHFCRKRKRRCDKRLPSCSFCVRYRRRCYYPPRRVESPVEEREFRAVTISSPDRQPEAVSVYFLDQEIFNSGRMVVPSLDSSMPVYVSRLVGDFDTIQQDAAEYFSTVHCWWSIISKQSFYNNLMNPLIPRRADAHLILLCMKLITWSPSAEEQDPRTSLYFAAKQYFTELEAAGVFSIRALQSGVLIAVYELGHGIYPSALLSIASCARYVRALDISLRPNTDSAQSLSSFESEERRRVWWAVLILDRFANISCPGRRFETDNPLPDDLLPADDAAWDAGTLSTDDEMPISCPSTEKMGRFAKLAQATHLLCRVLEHVSDRSLAPEFRETQERQLEKTLQASIRMVSGALRGPTGAHAMICYSSLFLLHGDALNIEPSTPFDIQRRDHARDVLERVSKTCATTAGHFIEGKALPVEKVAALVSHWNYRSAAFYLRMSREAHNGDYEKNLKTLRAGLRKLDTRWKVAGTYLRMLEAREVMSLGSPG